MTKANDIKRIWNLLSSIEVLYTETLLDDLRLSEELKDCEEKSPNKPPFAINYLEYYDSQEPVTSWILRHIFAYTYNGHHLFFESFAKTFLQRIGFKTDWIDAPVIDKDHEWKKRSKTSQKTGEKGECRTLQKSFEMLKKRSKTSQNRCYTGRDRGKNGANPASGRPVTKGNGYP